MNTEIEQLTSLIHRFLAEKPGDIQAALAALDPMAQAALDELVPRLQTRTPSQLSSDTINIDAINASQGIAIGAGAGVYDQRSTVTVNHNRIYGPTIGVHLGTLIYGRTPEEDERVALLCYLDALATRLDRLPLRVLDEQLSRGTGPMLTHVYVLLATTSVMHLAAGPRSTLAPYFNADEPTLRQEHHPDYALPQHAVFVTPQHDGMTADGDEAMLDDESDPLVVIERRLLAAEAVQHHRRLVLLGAPGAGKSTFLRHLAWALAAHGLGQPVLVSLPQPPHTDQILLPILVSLRTLAGRLATAGLDEHVVTTTLRAEMEQGGTPQPHIDNLLSAALRSGAVALLFDGLDEVPHEGVPGVTVDRYTTLDVVARFAQRYRQATIVVTCRTRAFDDRLRSLLDWPVETLAPFTLGQIRAFVHAWYAELVDGGQIDMAMGIQLTSALLKSITDNLKLRVLAETPLLLTMMALLLYKRGMLPRDRPRLYEAVLDLLLGQWDKAGKEGVSLGEAIGLADWTPERIRPLLDRLSYDAHRQAISADGRGRLTRTVVRDALIAFFDRDHPWQSWMLAQRCLDYIEQRSGLLLPDDPDTYAFAHLTLQEHCAGRHLLRDRHALSLMMTHRSDDRWREPILLGLGTIQESNPWLIESLLRRLIDRREDGQLKPVIRWYRDLIFAAEIGQDRDWSYLRDLQIEIKLLQEDLRTGLVALLADEHQPLPIAERVRSARLLGSIGDPRYPVSIAEWTTEITRALAGAQNSYFCVVPAGTYLVGSVADDLEATTEEQPQHQVALPTQLLIGRYPLTNAQWVTWVAEGGQPAVYADDPERNNPSQPVVGVSWFMANDFCMWLSAQLHALGLTGVSVRLPTEQEWEATARGGDNRRYPWGDTWADDRAAIEEDQDRRDALATVPVGCYPAGAAPGGACDMAGNVWEWTASVFQSYSDATESVVTEDLRVLRGGAYWSDRAGVRCAMRLWSSAKVGAYDHFGVRVVVSVTSA